MRSTQKSLIVVFTAAVTVLLMLILASFGSDPARQGSTPRDAEKAPAQTVAEAPPAAPASAVETTEETGFDSGKYFFDVAGHDETQFLALLERAYDIYEEASELERQNLRVVMVLHGPDVMFFDLRNGERHADILELASKLDAYGVFDFKMCTVSARIRDLGDEHIPDFVELVPYGPQEISRLEEDGYMRM